MGSKLEKERGNMLMKRSKFGQKLVEKDLEKRKKYKKEEITIIEKDVPSKYLNVYFANGEWFRYYVNRNMELNNFALW